MGQDLKEIIGILVIFILVITGIQWFLLKFTHWSVAMIVTGVISFILVFIYVSLSNASPNGGGSGASLSDYITPLLVVFSVLLCSMWLVCYLTQKPLPVKIVIVPLSIIVLLALGRYVYIYIENITVYCDLFSSCSIEVENKTGKEPLIREINFNATSSGITTRIDPNSNEQRNQNIPRLADRIIVNYYSDTTDYMLRQEFPFDYKLCREVEGKGVGLCFWVHPKSSLPIKFVLQLNNKIDLYIDKRFIQQYQLSGKE